MSDRWHRFTAAGWERSFFVIACAVAVVVAIVGVVALATRGGGNDANGNPALARRSDQTATRAPVTAEQPTAIVINVPDLPTLVPTDVPTPEPDNRRDCDAIRGTPYRSAAEREWYAQSCTAGGTGPTSKPPTEPPSGGGPQPTTAPPPTQPQGLTTAGAISLAVSYMTSNESESYTVDAGTCNAVQFSDHWSVNCTGRLSGCQSDACNRSLAVCVFSDRSVVDASQC